MRCFGPLKKQSAGLSTPCSLTECLIQQSALRSLRWKNRQSQFQSSYSHKGTIPQRLQVIVSVGTAQRILDSAVQAGANDIGSPEWLLKDYDLAQARVAGAGLGAKLAD